jgi:eukaryotic-like serine/threonine-protein kinase
VALVVNKAMSLDAKNRYQSPSAMLADLHIASRRLKEEVAGGDPGASHAALAEAAEPERSIMVVESNAQMQDLLRNGLKQAGFRVLLTADPGRALSRFRQDAATAECLLISAQEIGQPALNVFNELGDDKHTAAVPTVLLLAPAQRQWQGDARTSENRVVLSLPLTMKKLRQTLAGILGPAVKH